MKGDASRAVPGEMGLSAGAASTLRAETAKPGEARVEPRRTSLLRAAPALLLLIIAIADAGQSTDPDLWGHIRFGQAALAQHSVVLHDIYSYTGFGRLFRNHEWGTEFVMAVLYNHFGILGLKVWKLACVATTFVALTLALAEAGATVAIQINLLIPAAVAVMPQMQYRPQLFTFAFFAAMLAILARHYYRGRAPLWLLVPIMLLWVNLHGGFVIGIGTLGLYTAVVGLQDLIAGKGLKRGLHLAAYTIGALLAPLATPFGVDTWRMVLRAVFNPALRITIVDWHPLWFALATQWKFNHLGSAYYLIVLGFIAALIISVILIPRGGDLPFVLIAAVMSYAAWNAVRNMPLAVIACALPVARHSVLYFAGRRERQRAAGQAVAEPPEKSGVKPWIAVAVAIGIALSTGVLSRRLQFDDPYPSGAVAFMQQHKLRGNILGEFGWGEYLIWHMAPESKVFIDGRYDLIYTRKEIQDYINFRFDLRGGAKTLEAYPHDFVLIRPDDEAVRLMKRTPGWALIYRDQASMLYARAGSTAAQLPGTPVTGTVPKVAFFP